MPPQKSFPVISPDLPSGKTKAASRLLDLSVAVLLLLLTAPVLLPAMLAVALTSPGPVFYRQERVGLGGRLFRIWKLRTMAAGHSAGPSVTAQDDCRITPVGRHLRSWKVDELPQLLNVLNGEMSLVGPRPQVPRFVDCFDSKLRGIVLSVRPGMTGPTALYFRHEEFLLTGRGDRECFYIAHLLPVKLRMDAEYVRTRSLRGDIHVLTDTLHLVLSRLTGHAGKSGIPAACTVADIHALEEGQTATSHRAAEPARSVVYNSV